MADLIDRQALIDRLNPLYEHHLLMGNYFADGAVADCIEIVTEAPAVEPKKGEWIDFNTFDFFDPRMRCSHCGHVELPKANWNYCPNCGADMKGDNPNE